MTAHHDVARSRRRIHHGAPQLTNDQARSILSQHLGPTRAAQWTADGAVPGETDANFVFRSGSEAIVLKVAYGAESSRIELQNKALDFLSADQAQTPYEVPRVVPSAAGHSVEHVTEFGYELDVRVLTWVPGLPVADRALSDEALEDIGRAAGSLAARLARFDAPDAADSDLYWDLDAGAAVVDAGRDAVDAKDVLDEVLARTGAALQAAGPLPRALVHNDLNTFNVLVDTRENRTRVTGIIDFGDITVTSRVNDVAILVSAVCRGRRDFVAAACRIVAAYNRENPLSPSEIDVVFPLAILRLATVFVTTATATAADPRHGRSVGKDQLEALLAVDPVIVGARLRAACGAPIDDARASAVAWLEHDSTDLGPIVRGPLTVVDRTSRADEAGRTDHVQPEGVWVGRYAEPQSARGGVPSQDEERGDIALSVRVLGPVGTPILAPMGVWPSETPTGTSSSTIAQVEPTSGLATRDWCAV